MSKHAGEREALIGLGSNLGDRAATLIGAVKRLRSHPDIVEVIPSSVYETDPVGLLDQPTFLNAVTAVRTRLTPESLLSVLQEIEQTFGRERHERWGARTLDLDLLAFEREQRTTSRLTLPHPRIFEREFVLVPLRELLTSKRYPGAGKWTELLPPAPSSGAALTEGVRRFAGAELFNE